jgi:nucleoside-diphosphate-sugar epimerase
MNTLLTLGHGYSAQALAHLLIPQGWQVIGTARTQARAAELQTAGVKALIYPCDLTGALATASHILISAAPDTKGDIFLQNHGDQISASSAIWVGYLSTTAVYGDHQGAWVTEATPPNPQSGRALARVLAENQWLDTGLPVQIFRLAGIYGPGRGPFAKVRDGTARRIIKKNQVFSRIHVADIATTLAASIARPRSRAIYNVCDNNPAPPEDVLTYAADLLGLPPPPTMAYETAILPEMTRSFYAESKRVSNDLIKSELAVTLRYPTYQDGLNALLAAGD